MISILKLMMELTEKMFEVVGAGGAAHEENHGLLNLGLQDVELLVGAAHGRVGAVCGQLGAHRGELGGGGHGARGHVGGAAQEVRNSIGAVSADAVGGAGPPGVVDSAPVLGGGDAGGDAGRREKRVREDGCMRDKSRKCAQ